MSRPDDTKVCRLCSVEKPITSYYLRSDGNGRRRNECGDCGRARLRAKRDERGPRDWRAGYLMSKFGITQQDYDTMFALQGGCCALCGLPAASSYKGLHIDHDHESGRVRGLLCQRCNMALGLFGDNVTVLAEAIAYVSRSSDAARSDIYTDDGVVTA